MRICFVIEYYPPHIGGAEILFQNLAEGLVKAGHQCDVVTSLLPRTKRLEEIHGVTVHRVPLPRFADRYWFTFLCLFSAWHIARKADVIHTMTYNGALPAWVISKIQKKPLVMQALEVLGEQWSSLGLHFFSAHLFKLIEDLVFRLHYDAYSCDSLSTTTSLAKRGIASEKLFLAYPGIDYELFRHDPANGKETIRRRLGIKTSTFVYMYFGRPGMTKGVEYLVQAVPRIRKEIPDSRLFLILSKEPSNKRRAVMDLIRSLQLKDVVVIEPVPREQLPHYIQASDCVAVPSLTEGFGFTCVEACTMGKPVVATNVGSLPEVVFGKYVLVPPRDSEALARGVTRVFRKEYETSKRNRFPWEETIKRHINAYERLTSSI